MEVAGRRQDVAGVGSGGGEGPLVETSCLGGPAAGQPHVGEHDGGAQLVGEVARGAQAPDRLAERLHRRRELPRGPGRQSQEAGAPGAGDVVVRPRQVQGAAGVDARCRPRHHGPGRPRPGRPRPAPAGRAARRPGLCAASLGRPCRGTSVVVSRVRAPQRLVAVVEPALRPVRVALGQPGRRHLDRQQRPAAEHVVGQGVRARCAGGRPGACGAQPGGPARPGRPRARVACGPGVGDGVLPSAPCSACQSLAARCRRSTRPGSWPRTPGPQRLGEQVVVAEPASLVVERDDEDVRVLQGLEHRLPAVASGQGVAQRAGQPLEDRRARAGRSGPAPAGCRGPPRGGSPGRTGCCR